MACYDVFDFGHQPDEKRLNSSLERHCERTEELRSGLIALFEIDGLARHLGIIAEKNGYLTLIHAYAPAHKVVEHRLDDKWRSKIKALFSLPVYSDASISPHQQYNDEN